MSAAQRISASQLTLSQLNAQQIAQTVQIYQPAYQAGNVAQGLSVVPQDEATMAALLSSIQTGGFVPVLQKMIVRCGVMATELTPTASIPKAHVVYAGYVTPHPTKPACKPGTKCDPTGGSGYNCHIDGALNLAVGGAFGIIGILALPEVGVLTAAYWGGAALWGGSATLGWGAVHSMFCDF